MIQTELSSVSFPLFANLDYGDPHTGLHSLFTLLSPRLNARLLSSGSRVGFGGKHKQFNSGR